MKTPKTAALDNQFFNKKHQILQELIVSALMQTTKSEASYDPPFHENNKDCSNGLLAV